MCKFKNGDIVQLRSGGAPMTVIVDNHMEGSLKLAAVSVGGLVQELWAPPAAVCKYCGPLTPAIKVKQ